MEAEPQPTDLEYPVALGDDDGWQWTPRRTAVLVILIGSLLFAGSVFVGAIVGNNQRSSDAQRLAQQVKAESAIRTHQFCQLLLAQQADREKRLDNTITYLQSPAGKESTGSTGTFNAYIKKNSLPQIKQEVVEGAKNLPTVCRQRR